MRTGVWKNSACFLELNSIFYVVMWNIPQIIDRAGGAAAIAKRIKKQPTAVYKWKTIGIPDRHWPVLIEMAEEAFGPADLYSANAATRAEMRKAS